MKNQNQQQDKATPRPWQCDVGSKRIYGPDYSIAKTYGYNAVADAALIVKAVNEHSALVAVAEAAGNYWAARKNCKNLVSTDVALSNALKDLATIRAQQ